MNNDTTCTTVRTIRSRPSSATRPIGTTVGARRATRVPPRRSARVFTTGQLACEDYVCAVVEARARGNWL